MLVPFRRDDPPPTSKSLGDKLQRIALLSPPDMKALEVLVNVVLKRLMGD